MANKGTVKTLAFGVTVDAKKFNQAMRKIKKTLANFKKMIGNIAKAGAASFAALTGVVAASTKAFAAYGDAIAKTSRRVGVGTEALTGLKFAAERSGASFGALSTGLRTMSKSLVDASNGTGEAKDALAKLGIEASSMLDKNPEEQFKAIADRLSQVANPTQQAALAMRIFGESGTQLLPMLQEGGQGITDLQNKAKELGLTMGAIDATNAEKMTDALSDLGSQIKMTFIKIGAQVVKSGLVDYIKNFSENIMPQLFEWVEKVGERFRIWASAALPDLLASFGAVWDGAKVFFSQINEALSAIGFNFGTTAEDATENFSNMFLNIAKFFGSFRERMALGAIKMGDFIAKIPAAVLSMLGTAIFSIVQMVQSAIVKLGKMLAKLPKVGKAAQRMANNAAGSLRGFNNELNKFMRPIEEKGVVSSMLGKEVQGLKAQIQENDDAIVNAFNRRSTALQGFVDKSITSATEASKKLGKQGSGSFWDGLKSGLSSALNTAFDRTKKAMEGVKVEVAETVEAIEKTSMFSPAALAGSMEALRMQFGGAENQVEKDQLKVLKSIDKSLKGESVGI